MKDNKDMKRTMLCYRDILQNKCCEVNQKHFPVTAMISILSYNKNNQSTKLKKPLG